MGLQAGFGRQGPTGPVPYSKTKSGGYAVIGQNNRHNRMACDQGNFAINKPQRKQTGQYNKHPKEQGNNNQAGTG